MGPSYRFGRFELDPATRQLLADGAQVALGGRAFDVLVALVERRDRMVTKDELLEIAWPGLVVEENNLQVQISTLRKILGPQAIATVPGRGYRFAAALSAGPLPPGSQPVRDAPLFGTPSAGPAGPQELSPEAGGQLPSSPPPVFVTPARRWGRWSATAVLVTAGLAGWFWMRQSPPAPPAALESASVRPDSKTIAVLPFVNLSDDKGNAYFADGLHEDLLTQLSMLRDLKVVSRTSVMAFRSSAKKVGEIGSELGVGTLVEGSVRRDGDRVRVNAQVIDVRSDRHLWARTYDREAKDILTIQSELAAEIARALDVTLNPQDRARLTKRSTVSLAAYDLLLRHNYMRYQSVAKRIPLLLQAVELDPNFALAWARLAMDHYFLYAGADMAPGRLQQAKDAMARALALAPDDVEVRIEEGTFHTWVTRDLERAAQIYAEVLRLAPNNVEALTRLAFLRGARQARWAEQIALLQQALAIDPRNLDALVAHYHTSLDFRHYDEALAFRRRITAIRPDELDDQLDYPELEYLRTGSWDAYDQWRATVPAGMETKSQRVWLWDVLRAGARRDLVTRLQLIETPPKEMLARDAGKIRVDDLRAETLLAMGRKAEARAVARKLLAETREKLRSRNRPDDFVLRMMCAVWHAYLGEREQAFMEFESTRDLMRATSNPGLVHDNEVQRAVIHALLGDREHALDAIRQLLKRPGVKVGRVRTNVYFFALWDDPRFLALVNDPASNAPLPFDWKDPGG